MNVKFSILIPAFKATYLYECIESILKQTYSNFEIIVLDDCSPFNLQRIVDKFKDKRLKFFRNEKNVGIYDLVDNWNKCLDLSSGDYVICMGDDDKLLPECLSNYEKAISIEPTCKIFHVQTIFINSKSDIVDVQLSAAFHESVYAMMYNIWKGRETRIGDFLFESTNLKNKGGFFKTPCGWHSDRITSFIMASVSGVVNVPQPGFLFRLNSEAITSNTKFSVEKVEAWKEIYLWYDKFLGEYPTNDTDLYYYLCLKQNIKHFIGLRKLGDILRDIEASKLRYFYWLKNKKKYELSKNDILTLTNCFLRSFLA